RPFCKIDNAATGTAEREVRVGPLHALLANRTSYARGAFAGHKRTIPTAALFDDPGDEIVIVCFGDLASVELPGFDREMFGHFVHEYLAVYLLRMHRCASLQQQFAFLGRTLEQEIEGLSD